MKKLICILLSLLMFAVSFSGCGEKTPAPAGESEAPQTVQTASAETPNVGGKETLPPKRPLEERFAAAKCEVLARTVVPAETVKLYGNSGENATVLTLRLDFPDWETQNDCGSLRILDAEGNKPVQDIQGWKNSYSEETAAANVYLAILEGDVEPSGLKLVLKEAYGKKEAEIPVEAGPEQGVYEALHEAFPTEVVRLQGRSYFVVNRGAWSTNGDRLARSILMVPLEGGFDCTLDKAGVRIDSPAAGSDAVTLYVNEFDEIDHRTDAYTQQAITVVVREGDGIDGDKLSDFFKSAVIVIDDGAGNPVQLSFA